VPDGTPLRTLLYVEDNPANLELVEQLVARRADLRMLSAADGALGIEFARTCQPDLILMDINLPGISGIEALKICAQTRRRRISRSSRSAPMPVPATSRRASRPDSSTTSPSRSRSTSS
jgi:CheY-like chemotaxis protein